MLFRSPEDTKNDLIITIPGFIDAIIQLTKGESLNRNIKGLDVVETAYVTRRAICKIIEYIRNMNYGTEAIIENIFMIVTQTMYIVGSYHSLAGNQKKEIVIDVIEHIVKKHREVNGKKIPDKFVQTILDSLPSIIDTLVLVSDKKFIINQPKKLFSFCFPCC